MSNVGKLPITDPTVARPSGCRIETRLDAWRWPSAERSVETSLDAADTSVRATKNKWHSCLWCIALIVSVAQAETPALTGFPFQDEALRYRVTWPGGAGLGEGRMKARRIEGGRWEFELTLDASVPGVTIQDRYLSVATADLCSVNFERESVHGAKKAHETVTFAQDDRKAHRATSGGGSTDFSVPACARDALTFLYFTRREMGQGRVPPADKIVYGGPYDIRLEYPGPETLKGAITDRLVSAVRGPSSNVGFDLLFARDAARTPVLIRVPLALGTFSLELIR